MILQYCCSGFPHSDICVSMDICSSTQLFAACHVLLRLLMPRHSSYALLRLTSSELSLPASFCSSHNFALSVGSSSPKKTGFFRYFIRRFRLFSYLPHFSVLSNSSKNNLSFSLSSLRFYVSKFCSVISFRYLVQLSQHFT